MNIHHVEITSATPPLTLTATVPLCILRGRHSDLVLDWMRELIGDFDTPSHPDRVDSGRFVIHAEVEIDHKHYKVCYIRNAEDTGEHRLAVNFETNSIHFSEDDTREFMAKCSERHRHNRNVLRNTVDIAPGDDDRPLFLYDSFDRLDEAIDITPVLDKLASLGRQVFIAVCQGYPTITHDKVQMVQL